MEVVYHGEFVNTYINNALWCSIITAELLNIMNINKFLGIYSWRTIIDL